MPRLTRQMSGYAILAQAEEEEEDETPYSDNEDPFQDPPTVSTPGAEYAPIQPKRREHARIPSADSSSSITRRPRRRRANSAVDIKAINARLERWAEEIKEKFKRRRVKGKSAEEETLEIHHSVFQAPEGIRPANRSSLDSDYDDSAQRLSKIEFDDVVESVRTAIELGLHPTLISQGSSGSYFARNSGGKVVGVFKPKDEEPYASKNPKWTKWIHRNLFPFAFGRACLIPNLSYVSEAAAYVLDAQLRTNLVPHTDVVGLSSKSFHYDYFDRKAYYRKNKPLPEKLGSFQVFLKGFKGATEFLREHPWPEQVTANAATPAPRKKRRKRWDETCRPKTHPTEEVESDAEESDVAEVDASNNRNEFWSPALQTSFREQLEKLVILDYIMRNTDRGLDNWMIRIDKEKDEATIVRDLHNRVRDVKQQANGDLSTEEYHRRNESMTPTPSTPSGQGDHSVPRIGAIDNSLSWPWKHPDAWRSFPFGWLFLPVSLIGRPFTEQTRRHFLPLLTSKEWWSETQVKLRKTFEIDADFQERMFARQIAVMKGQAWNVVETLKTPDHGPLELTRRSRVCVWDDLVDIPVALPLGRPSEEMRRNAATTAEAEQVSRRPNDIREEPEEEMDISAARGEIPKNIDLLGITSPRESRENPFNHSRQNSDQDIHTAASSPTMRKKELSASAPRPGAFRSRTAGRTSFDAARSLFSSSPTERRRRFSLNVGRSRGLRAGSWDEGDLEDDGDGDLGYSAASERQNATRKVIVERLEMVKNTRSTEALNKITRDPGLPCSNPTSSFWQEPPHPELSNIQSPQLPEKTDVLIIGSGITAASVAHHLLATDSDIHVTVAEARTICSGATGRNGGHILELPYDDYDMEVSLLGKEAAKKLIQFRIDHLNEILQFVKTELSEEAARKCEIRKVEVVDAFHDLKEWEVAKAQLGRFFQTFPEQVDKWNVFERDEARKKFGMPHVSGVITGPSGAIWPYRFVTSVFENLLSKFPDRIQIETNTPIKSLTTANSPTKYPYLVRTPRGTIQCSNVVHATNGHVAHLVPRLRGKIFPIRGQMTVQSLTGAEKPANMGSERSWLPRYSKGYDYLTQNPVTGDYFLGGGALQGGLEDIGNPSDEEQSFLALCHLSGALSRMFGAASGSSALSSTVKASWTGTLGFSCDGRPWVGRLPAEITERHPPFENGHAGGEYIAAGYCGSGMVYCWKSGRVIADMILRRDTGWFPECLMVTESRYRSSDARDMTAYWLDLAIN